MFFGKGGKAEEIDTEDLEKYLNDSFNSKLAPLESRGSRIVGDLERTKNEFAKVSDNFEHLDVEPEMENWYFDRANFIKGQKAFYSKALRHTIDEWNVSNHESPNLYLKYAAVLSSTEKFINETLADNTKFKKVIYSYGKHMDPFKNSFSHVERLRDSLNGELSRVERELQEYNEINNQILKLQNLQTEFDSANETIQGMNENLKTNPKEDGNSEESKLSESLSNKNAELSKTSSEISTIHSRISSAANALERPARKYDHVSKRKKQLATFLSDVFTTVKDEADYNELVALLEGMSKSLDSREIDEKNISKIKETISELLKMNAHESIKKIEELHKRRHRLEMEINSLSVSIDEIKTNRSRSQRTAESIEHAKKSIDDIKLKIQGTKTRIEELFLSNYNKKISVRI